MEFSDFLIRISFAVLFGFLIGLERQLTGSHSAGIRVNVLISMGACLFTIFSLLMYPPDTTRIAAQVVTGIGFLCSGIIFKEGFTVHGLSTAATMWCTAAIGVLTSGGWIQHSAAAVAILIVSNIIFRFTAERFKPFSRFEENEGLYLLSATCFQENEFAVRFAIVSNLTRSQIQLTHLESADAIGNHVEIEAKVIIKGKSKFRDEAIEKLTAQIALEQGVTRSGWEML